MRALLQRVLSSSVRVDGKTVGQIKKGLNILLGVGHGDTIAQVKWLAEKVVHLRIFEDENQKMNLSVLDIKGSVLVISQFTLYADCEKGRRPSFALAAAPNTAKQLYADFITELKTYGLPVKTGIFQADMNVQIENDGPVTVLIETPNPNKTELIQTQQESVFSIATGSSFEAEAQMMKRNITLRKKQKESHHG